MRSGSLAVRDTPVNSPLEYRWIVNAPSSAALLQCNQNMDGNGSTKMLLRVAWSMARLFWLCYYIGTLSYRVCLLHPIHFKEGDVTSIVLDYLADLFFIVDSVWLYRNNSVEPESRIPFQTRTIKSKSPNVVAITPKTSDETPPTLKGSRYEQMKYYCGVVWEVVSVFPFEVIAFGAGMDNFGYLRLFRLMRSIHLSSYWDMFTDVLERNEISTNTVTHRLFFVMLVQLIACHVSACIFYALSINLLYRGSTNTWLYRDGDATFGPDGEVILLNGVHYRYIRAWYWSAATYAGIGFGDIASWGESETWFVQVMFYLVVLLICSCIVLFFMLMTNYDSAKIENRLKVVRFNKYAAYRKLPTDLTNRVLSYYEYQWQLLRGIDENNVSYLKSAFLELRSD
jgi:hypothetical protein